MRWITKETRLFKKLFTPKRKTDAPAKQPPWECAGLRGFFSFFFFYIASSSLLTILQSIRGLEMLDIVFERSLKDPEEELNVSFTHAYEVTLKPHHGYLIRQVFAVSLFPLLTLPKI